MSEYQDKFTVTRLTGSPPGYVGYDEGGQLTEAVKKQRHSVVLFDEVEKAHPDVLNVLLQIMDDRRLTDGRGLTVDFRQTLLILTSNLGNQPAQVQRIGFVPHEATQEGADRETERRSLDAVHQHFRPEFLGRLSATVVFRRFTLAQLMQIVELELDKLAERIGHGVLISASEAAVQSLAEQSVNLDSNARQVSIVLRDQIEPGLIELRRRGALGEDGQQVFIDVDASGDFRFDVAHP